MLITVNGITCEYEITETDKNADTVLFLHGWGGDLRSFEHVYSVISDLGVNCINFAFPKTVPDDWGVYDYATLVVGLLNTLNIKMPVIVGHSFGGRIAIILAAQGTAKKIVLVDSAGLKPKFSLKKKIRLVKYRRAKKCGKPLDGYGSIDYNNLEPSMRKVFVRIVNAHLDNLLPYIKCDTLVFWGKHDKDTPMYMAKRLKRRIANSRLVTVDGGHYSYVDADHNFIQQLKSFISE